MASPGTGRSRNRRESLPQSQGRGRREHAVCQQKPLLSKEGRENAVGKTVKSRQPIRSNGLNTPEERGEGVDQGTRLRAWGGEGLAQGSGNWLFSDSRQRKGELGPCCGGHVRPGILRGEVEGLL